MSTIVVVKKNNEVAIAADTLTTMGGTKISAEYKTRREKILHFQDTYIGFVGYCVHQNVFESLMEKHADSLNFKGHRDIFETFLKLHRILKDDYYVNTTESKNDPYESSQMDIVIANAHGIFDISSYRNVTELDSFWAVGSGRDYALGALYHAYDTMKTAREIAVAGVVAACEFDNASGLPYTVHSMPLLPGKVKMPREEKLIVDSCLSNRSVKQIESSADGKIVERNGAVSA